MHKGSAGVQHKALQEASCARLVGQLGQEAVKVLRDLVCLVRGARFRGDARPPCCPMQPQCALVLRERSHTQTSREQDRGIKAEIAPRPSAMPRRPTLASGLATGRLRFAAAARCDSAGPGLATAETCRQVAMAAVYKHAYGCFELAGRRLKHFLLWGLACDRAELFRNLSAEDNRLPCRNNL